MKEALAVLCEIVTKFPDDAFYCNAYYEESIKLQGRFCSLTIKKALDEGFILVTDVSHGYIELAKGNITITLTD